MEEAESDCHMWAEHLQAEQQQLESLGKLEEIKSEVKESITDEIYELEMIRDQCVKDASKIGEQMWTSLESTMLWLGGFPSITHYIIVMFPILRFGVRLI